MAAIKQTVDSTLTSDLIIRNEYIGLQTLMAPFLQNCSAQRQMMYASHSAQSLVLEGSEQPRIMTGYEHIIGDYEFTKCRVDQDIVIRRVIPKFNPVSFKDTSEAIPSYTVVYTGCKDGLVHCMEVPTYTFLHDGFGYFNKMPGIEEDMLHEGNLIKEGTKLTTSPSHDGNAYKMGFNANVCFLSEWSVTEDAFTISKSLAEKGANWDFRQVKLNIGIDTIPLDLYGDGENYKCFPSIGELVRPDGVLMALRKENKTSFVSDMPADSLRTIEYLHDEAHRAPKGSRVVDVDVFINHDAMRKMKDRDNSIYKQFIRYVKSREYYHNAIVETYQKLCGKDGEGLTPAPEFNTQVVRSSCLANNRKMVSKPIKLYDARDPVEFITVVITYACRRKITIGTKLTGREGGKGVVAAIWDDENMPVDDNGHRADIIMTPASTINRMNPSQFYEQFWNRTSEQVVINCKKKWLNNNFAKGVDWAHDPYFQKNWHQIYKYVLEYFNDFRPAYALFIHNDCCNGSEKNMFEFTAACMSDGLYLINAFRDPPTPEDIIRVAKKYGVERTPVTYRVKDPTTGQLKTVRTLVNALVGSKFLMVLGKIPSAAISAVAISHVSQFETPIKPKSKHIKSQNVIGLTPQKFGEDETCILNMSVGPSVVARLYGTCASSPEIVKEMTRRLLKDPKPTTLSCLPLTTQEVINKNQNVSMMNHMFAICGYDLTSEENTRKETK